MTGAASGVPQPRPVIGISAYAARASWGVWDVEADLVPHAYVDRVARAGGVPVVLPALPGLIDLVLPRLDGLVLAGGPDVDPARYGAEPGPDTQPPSAVRDAAESDLLAAAAGLALPVLGVCRGMQLMNVARGGTLVQHLPDVVEGTLHCPAPGRYGLHDVDVAPGTVLAAALGVPAGGHGRARVPSYHHQGVDAVGSGLAVSARSVGDGVVEALEDPALPFWLGVQWHPEVAEDVVLFEALVGAAARRAAPPGLDAGGPAVRVVRG